MATLTTKAETRDLLLPLAVVAVVGLMILPLPAFLLDTLLMCNIAFALCLLISSVYLSESEEFSSLPMMLLLATLFRLGLNISTTRQLLSSGEPPEIVAAFGNFVVGGNLAVGVVIFSIITVVQFLVISKGAERIAEVAARFTLDAMPGKQMAIDADVRAGIIGLGEAKEKRKALHRESKLFGALDGAMKFVKGDAIAGLLITIINITAGVVVGVTQQGLDLGTAFRKFTLFTVGDGLVSQVPALLVAVAAGIVVTRVENKDRGFIGREMFAQLGREPQALGTCAGVMLILAFVPGMPTVPFLGASILFFLIAKKGVLERAQAAKEDVDSTFQPKIFSPLVLRLSLDAARVLQQEAHLPQLIKQLRSKTFDTRGVTISAVEFDIDDSLVDIQASIFVHGVAMEKISFANEGNSGGDKANGSASMNGFSARIADSLGRLVEKNLLEFIDDTHTRILLEAHQATAEDLINSVVPKLISITGLTTLFRQLLLENVSIRDMRRILQAISEYNLNQKASATNQPSSSPQMQLSASLSQNSRFPHEMCALLAHVREALGRTISADITHGSSTLEAFVLSPELDYLFAKLSILNLPPEPDFADRITSIIRGLRERDPELFVVLTSRSARLPFSQLMAGYMPDMRVISVSELSADIKLTHPIYVEVEGLSLNGKAPSEFSETNNMPNAAAFSMPSMETH